MTDPDPALSLDFWLSSGDSRVWNLRAEGPGDRLGAADRRADGEADRGARRKRAQAAVRSRCSACSRTHRAGRVFRRAARSFVAASTSRDTNLTPALRGRSLVGGGDDRREAVVRRACCHAATPPRCFAAFLGVRRVVRVAGGRAAGARAISSTGALGLGAQPRREPEARARFGLDRSIGAQYAATGWAAPCASISAARSLYDRPVSDLMPERAANTAILALTRARRSRRSSACRSAIVTRQPPRRRRCPSAMRAVSVAAAVDAAAPARRCSWSFSRRAPGGCRSAACDRSAPSGDRTRRPAAGIMVVPARALGAAARRDVRAAAGAGDGGSHRRSRSCWPRSRAACRRARVVWRDALEGRRCGRWPSVYGIVVGTLLERIVRRRRSSRRGPGSAA